jgi:hypothetical protein
MNPPALRALLAITPVLGLLSAPSLAAADPPDWIPVAQESRVGMEVDWLHRPYKNGTSNAVTWDLLAQIGVTRNVFLDAGVPWAYVVNNPELVDFGYGGVQGYSRALFGVPTVGVHYGAKASPHIGFFVGLALGIPVLGSVPGTPEALLARWDAAEIRAHQDRHRFLTGHMPVLLRGGVEIRAGLFFARIEVAPGVLIGFGACPGKAALDRTIDCSSSGHAVYLDQGNDLGVRAPFGLLGGVRVQESFLFTEGRDRARVALEPFLGYESPRCIGIFARYGLLVTLDPERRITEGGLAADQGHLLTHRFSVGAKF